MKILFLLLTLAGCGDSPLLNHKEPLNVSRAFSTVRGHAFPGGATFEINWNAGCPSSVECGFRVELEQALSVGDTLFAELWMPSMGHGSSPITARNLGPSSWEFTKVFFIMPGQWELVLKIKTGSRVRDEVRLPYRI